MKNQHTKFINFDKPTKDSFTIFKSLVISACKESKSLYALKVLTLVRYDDFDNLLSECDVDPLQYNDAVTYLKDAQLCALFKKFPHLPTRVNTREAAMKAFINAEIACWETNTKFRKDPLLSNEGDALFAIMRIAKRKIGSILGKCPLPEQLDFQFGPGSNVNVSKFTSSFHKLDSSLDVTSKAVCTATRFLSSCPGWLDALGVSPTCEADIFDALNIIPGSKLSFVPKTAKTDRPIGIEPLINGTIQKGIGSCIRSRLKRKGLNLDSAQHLHRDLAKKSSIDSSLATIDLRSASDTISYLVVMNLLPWDWFQLMDSVRSPQYSIQGNTYDFHKFSSMGNGYTFELESLIFLALTRAVMEYMQIKGTHSVFGDDIIVPTECAELLETTLTAFGFQVNAEKSFTHGPFRESCGGDYFSGVDVRPFYIKDSLSPRIMVLMHNSWKRSGMMYIFPKTFRLLLTSLPNAYKHYGPEDGTDGHLLSINWGLKPYRSIIAIPIYLKASKENRLYGAFALYRQMFSSFPLIYGLFEAVRPFMGHTVRGRFRYIVKRKIPL